jgi:3',5'-cyclic AMP phosphodiesterase CpdA
VTAPSLLIAQISDLHIKRPGRKAYGIVDTAAALQRCIAHLNTLNPQPALVVCSGDLVDGGSDEEYAHLKELLAPLKLPLVAIPGNHDAREAMRRAFPDQAYAATEGALNTLVRAGDLDLILLDSSVPGKPHGFLEKPTLAWLDATLADAPQRPALIFLHHPPFITGIHHMDVQNLRNADELATLVARHHRVRLIAAGHVHRATMTTFAGIPATICPAPNHAVDLDLAQLRPPSFTVEPPALHLHAWFATESGGNLVTHLVPIGQFDGPHPFFGKDGKLL